jgi:hypothetical protein
MLRNMRISMPVFVVLLFALLGVFVLVLFVMGRMPICECGYIQFWLGMTAITGENSQHFADWYTFSHVIHGFFFYWLLWFWKRDWPVLLRLLVALSLESAWEIFENTDFIINRYRESTASLHYFGDSIVNSLGDVLANMLGFVLAWKIPVWATVSALVVMELLTLYLIKDNLFLNIVMLVHPFESIVEWQLGG